MRRADDMTGSEAASRGERVKGRADAEVRDFLTRLTDSWDIDDDLENLFWAYSSKDIVLSNLADRDIRKLMDGFEETVYDYIIQQPEHNFSWEEYMAIGQFEDWLYVRLKRSKDGFERKMETTETSISRQVLETPKKSGGGGLTGKLKRLFGKGGEEEKGPREGVPIE